MDVRGRGVGGGGRREDTKKRQIGRQGRMSSSFPSDGCSPWRRRERLPYVEKGVEDRDKVENSRHAH